MTNYVPLLFVVAVVVVIAGLIAPRVKKSGARLPRGRNRLAEVYV